MSANIVNRMRCFSSVALDRAERLKLAASCSAADAIGALRCGGTEKASIQEFGLNAFSHHMGPRMAVFRRLVSAQRVFPPRRSASEDVFRVGLSGSDAPAF